MKTIDYCISNVIRYRFEYKFLIKNCVCIMKICITKKKPGTQYFLKSIETGENPIFYYGKLIPRKGNV